MAALGVLHRRVLGKLPQPMAELLPFQESVNHVYRTRLVEARHSHQFLDPVCGKETQLFKRSLFGFIAIYDRLPQHVVDCNSVRSFQKHLQDAMRVCMHDVAMPWPAMYNYSTRTSDICRLHRYV